MTLSTVISKYYSTGLFTVQFADGEGIHHSCSVDGLKRNRTNVIPAIAPAVLTVVFGNMEYCMFPGCLETWSIVCFQVRQKQSRCLP